MDDPPSLEPLRSELAGVDRQILELIARRQRLAAEVGRHKIQTGQATRDFRQEKVVLGRARQAAEELGVDPELAADVLIRLIRSSLTKQERDRVAAAATGEGRSALVIGGGGKMGGWFRRFLKSQGYRVQIADPCAPPQDDDQPAALPDWRASPLDHDLIVVAAPLRTSGAILEEMATRPVPPGVIFDLGSLKSPLRAGLRALAGRGARVTSVHPMFGPDTHLLSGRHVIFVDVGHAEATRVARSLFEDTMAVQVEMDLDAHDRLIAYVLGLSHAVNIAFFTALAESGETALRLAEMSSTTFDAQLDVASRVADESPDLYFEIQSLNDYGTESIAALLYAVERLRSVVRAGDERGFRALMETGRSYLTREEFTSRREQGHE